MDLGRPYSAVAPTVEGDVLVVLVKTTAPMTGREVARLVRRGSQPAVADALDRLAMQGVVHRERVGSAFLHRLNREHVAAPAVEALAGLRSELFARLRVALEAWHPAPVHASVFGSAARGDGDVQSDIDLFVVRPTGIDEDDERWRTQIAALADGVLAWTGNHAGIVEFPKADVPRLRSSSARVVRELRKDSIDLVGTPLRKLLGSPR